MGCRESFSWGPVAVKPDHRRKHKGRQSLPVSIVYPSWAILVHHDAAQNHEDASTASVIGISLFGDKA
jgi:hypothetical protein